MESQLCLFIDQFVEPLNIEQGLYLYEMGDSLEKETNTSNVKLPEGSMLIINIIAGFMEETNL